MKTLAEARVVIDAIDREIVKLFEERMKAVEDVVKYKIANNLPIFDAAREQQVIQKNMQYLQDKHLQEFYIAFLTHFMDISKKYQKTFVSLPAVGYQGTKGAFSQIAAHTCFPDYPEVSYPTFASVFDAVMQDEIAYGVIPFENSYTGEVGEVLDLLKKYDVYITDMMELKVNQNLLGVAGSTIEDIKQVYSHHQAISQCQQFLRNRNWEVVPYPNTAMAAQYVMQENDTSKAAIAAKETADLYGLSILANDINTALDNTTRFITIGKTMKTTGNRFSLLFSVKHDAGQLANVMQLFAMKGFNLENIRSRSMKEQPWMYYFYVEVIGSLEQEETKILLDEMRKQCLDLRVLGSYQR